MEKQSLGVLPAPVSVDGAEEFLSAQQFDAVISLVEPRPGGRVASYGNRLEVLFADISNRSDQSAPNRDQIVRLSSFLDEQPPGSSLLVHCEYGQSRSTSVALAAAFRFGWDPEKAAWRLAEMVPRRCFYPNILILELFDEVYGTGRLPCSVGERWQP